MELSWREALQKLKDGNVKYINARYNGGDVSPEKRRETYENGQKPYAVVVACSDSRVIPESIFFAGIGELFTVRVAGNVIDSSVLASVEYAVAHLKAPLVAVMGHTSCGAVNAVIGGGDCGRVKMITDKIRLVLGEERDARKACILNAKAGAREVERALGGEYPAVKVVCAVYNTDSGKADFFVEFN